MKALIAILLVAALAFGAWYYLLREDEEPARPPEMWQPEPAEPRVEDPPLPRATDDGEDDGFEPVTQAPRAPLPPLSESDPVVADAWAELVGPVSIAQFLELEAVIPRLVATIDNLPNDAIGRRINPLVPARGSLQVAGEEGDERRMIDVQNPQRYTPYVELAEAIDSGALADTYQRYYPLFQEAYADLGYPDRAFNDRLLEVIDHLLAAPEIEGPLEVVKPEATWEFADPELEALSAGQKSLVRMGPDNARRVKERLRALRGELETREFPPPEPRTSPLSDSAE